jgi:hypothetical protein
MDRDVKEQFEIFCGKEIKWIDWLWCNRCHRCYKASEFRTLRPAKGIFLRCHYKDCAGDLPLDSRLWSKVSRDRAELPEIPQRGKIYNVESDSRQATEEE